MTYFNKIDLASFGPMLGDSIPVYPIDPKDRQVFQYVSLEDIGIVQPQWKWTRETDMLNIVWRDVAKLPGGLLVNEVCYGEASLMKLLDALNWRQRS